MAKKNQNLPDGHDEEDYEEDATEEEGKEFGEKDEIEIIEE